MIYEFSIGNSDTGPIGAIIDAHGTNAADALKTLQENLRYHKHRAISDEQPEDEFYEYLSVIVNPDHITIANCLRSETEPCTRDDCEFCEEFQTRGDGECSECYEPCDNGEGYKGKCGNCADRAEASKETLPQ